MPIPDPIPRSKRNHKDTVFRDLFGAEERKANALSLYKALGGRQDATLDDLEFTTLQDVIYMGVKNDISFLIDDQLNLWEHQSTPNPNMPLRGLQYFDRLYASIVDKRELSIYNERLIALPVPRYVVFYIGREDRPDRQTLLLSDAYRGDGEEGPEGDLEVRATVININAGHNSDLMEACEALAGYSHLVALIREYNQTMSTSEAVDAAVRACIAEDVLKGYLSHKRAEVTDMFITEYDEQETLRRLRKEWIAEGRAEGEAEGKAEMLARGADLVRRGSLTIEQAAMAYGCTPEELEALL